jgi:hypothetical protein
VLIEAGELARWSRVLVGHRPNRHDGPQEEGTFGRFVRLGLGVLGR